MQVRVLAVLTLVNFLNYVDRQVAYGLVPLIKTEFTLSNFQVGLLGTVFSVVHSLGALPLALLADRVSRRLVISSGVIFWSLATFVCGLASSFRQLLAVRALVGVGEAAFAPAATAIITGSFARGLRARVQGVFDTGMFIGGSVGLGLGGLLAEWIGWRAAFFVVGFPGLLLALSVLRLPEPAVAKAELIPLRDLLRVPAYVTVLISGWFITFAAYALIFWGTEFVYRYKGFRLGEAGIILGLTLAVAGVLGILTGAALADRLVRVMPSGRILVIGVGLLLGSVPLLAALHTAHKTLFVALFFVACFFLSWYHGPLTAVVHDLIPERAHATAMGMYLTFVNLFAITLAPVVVGALADRFGLLAAMHAAVAALVAGALCCVGVVYCIRRDGMHHPALARYRETPAAPAGWTSPAPLPVDD